MLSISSIGARQNGQFTGSSAGFAIAISRAQAGHSRFSTPRSVTDYATFVIPAAAAPANAFSPGVLCLGSDPGDSPVTCSNSVFRPR